MRLDQRVQRLQQLGDRANLVGKRGETEVNAFMGVSFGLTVEGLMLAVLFEVRTAVRKSATVAAG
jgi:hypothetical protein